MSQPSPSSPSKIWRQLLATIAAALLVVWLGVIVWQGYVSRQAALEQAQDFSLSMHNATMAGLTGMMVTGTVGQRDVFLDQIKQLGSIRDVRVLRGDNVNKLFGPGTAKNEATADAQEAAVLQSGHEAIGVESDASGEYPRATCTPRLKGSVTTRWMPQAVWMASRPILAPTSASARSAAWRSSAMRPPRKKPGS